MSAISLYTKLLEIFEGNKCIFPDNLKQLGYFLESSSNYAKVDFVYKKVFPFRLYFQYFRNGNLYFFYIYFLEYPGKDNFLHGAFDIEKNEWLLTETCDRFITIAEDIIENYEFNKIINDDLKNRVQSLEF